ncbi:MAG: hypothetical protein AAGC46_04275 [Solirubrobacteraceae bacterium]|nr:hypothetical protein [Patulibacter sp.]
MALTFALATVALPATASAGIGSWTGSTASTATTTATTTAAAATTTAAAATTTTATATTTGCTPMDTTQSFAKYGDDSDYYLAPGGSFESGGPAWTLTGGAKIVSGNESLGVSSGSKALQLPVFATATSPAFCVDASNPSFRFASKLSSLDGGYAAIVIYRNAAGKVTSSQFTSSADGTFYNGATAWNPSDVSPLATNIPLLAGGGTASVQLQFVGTTKAYGMFVGSTATIDSVMVDPYRRG